jgi:hypothetical protein
MKLNKIIIFVIIVFALSPIYCHFPHKTKVIVSSQHNKRVSAALSSNANYHNEIKSIDDAAELIRSGNDFFKMADFKNAADAYRKSYLIGGGSWAVSGFHLAETYEKLGLNEESINILDDMIENNRLSRLGIKDAEDMKMRLKATKK